MPITVIDARAALVVIDLQQGLRDHPLRTPFADIAARAAFHAHGVERVFPRIAETGSTADVLALLSQRGSPA